MELFVHSSYSEEDKIVSSWNKKNEVNFTSDFLEMLMYQAGI